MRTPMVPAPSTAACWIIPGRGRGGVGSVEGAEARSMGEAGAELMVLVPSLFRQFRNYGGLTKIARCGFLWEKTTKRPIPSVYTNCETYLTVRFSIPLRKT